MKYLDLNGLQTAINNVKTWALAQFSQAEIESDVITAAYNGTVGDELTDVFSSAEFTETYNALTSGKFLKLPAATGYATPISVWTYTVGSSQIIGLNIIDVFGGTNLIDAAFEFMRTGSTVTLSLRNTRQISTI